MKPNLLVAGDSFAEFPRSGVDFDTLEDTRIHDFSDYPHWCELWAQAQGATTRSVAMGGSGNPEAINAALRALAQDTYTHCVYFITEPNRTVKRNTDHLKRGDLDWNKYDYIERRHAISYNWEYATYQQAITSPRNEYLERLNSNHARLEKSNNIPLKWEWIKYAMNLTPTCMPAQENIANIALLNSACNARRVKLMVTSGFKWPESVETWHTTDCYPKFTKFDFWSTYRPNWWSNRSHYDAKGHIKIHKLLRRQGLQNWLT